MLRGRAHTWTQSGAQRVGLRGHFCLRRLPQLLRGLAKRSVGFCLFTVSPPLGMTGRLNKKHMVLEQSKAQP